MKKYFLILLLISPIFLFAWGKEGHEIVVDIAKTRLNKGVEKQVRKYLDEMTFEKASVWMDEARSNHSLDNMKTWHYLNIEKNETYVKSPDGDVTSELTRVINELKNYRKMEEKDVFMDLKILFHLCGDITQPLHVGYGNDRGGNNVKITYKDQEIKLHHFWDSDIIENEKITLETCITISNKLTESEKKSIEKIDVMQWMNDSRLNLPAVYNFKNNIINQQYIEDSKTIIENQLIKGGYRLASVLNEIFK